MVGRGRFHHHSPDDYLFAWLDFLHSTHALSAQERGRTSRDNETRITIQQSQGRWVEVIPMRVRNQNSIRLSKTRVGHGHLAVKRADTVTHHGVRQNPDSIHLYEHCGVPHVGQARSGFHWTTAISPEDCRLTKPTRRRYASWETVAFFRATPDSQEGVQPAVSGVGSYSDANWSTQPFNTRCRASAPTISS